MHSSSESASSIWATTTLRRPGRCGSALAAPAASGPAGTAIGGASWGAAIMVMAAPTTGGAAAPNGASSSLSDSTSTFPAAAVARATCVAGGAEAFDVAAATGAEAGTAGAGTEATNAGDVAANVGAGAANAGAGAAGATGSSSSSDNKSTFPAAVGGGAGAGAGGDCASGAGAEVGAGMGSSSSDKMSTAAIPTAFEGEAARTRRAGAHGGPRGASNSEGVRVLGRDPAHSPAKSAAPKKRC